MVDDLLLLSTIGSNHLRLPPLSPVMIRLKSVKFPPNTFHSNAVQTT